jgi:hypothetical protein
MLCEGLLSMQKLSSSSHTSHSSAWQLAKQGILVPQCHHKPIRIHPGTVCLLSLICLDLPTTLSRHTNTEPSPTPHILHAVYHAPAPH